MKLLRPTYVEIDLDIIKHNIYVDKIYEYKKSSGYLKKLAKEIAEEKYDLLIDTSTILREKQIMFIISVNVE